MDIYKLKFTILQEELVRFLLQHPSGNYTANALALQLHVSPTAIAKAIPNLVDEELITATKDKLSKRRAIQLVRSARTIALKRVENLRLLYATSIVEYLTEQLPGSTIILFGSFAFGEDVETSDIDIAVIGSKKKLEMSRFEKSIKHPISLQYYSSMKGINTHLKENLCNGIVLQGSIEL